MSDTDVETIRRAAHLARLEITEEEARTLGPQFARILAHFEELARLDVQGVEPTTGATDLRDVRRADLPRPSFERERLLAGAPERADAFYSVPKTVRSDGADR